MKTFIRIISLSLAVLILLSLCACGSSGSSATNAPVDTSPVETTTTETFPTGPEALQGKKIMFIGNSYSFCGFTVIGGECTVMRQDLRENDQGIFYNLCKANGIDVSVTNWAFGSHHLCDFFEGECNAGRECNGSNHEMHITDPYFDYVVFQPHTEREYMGDFVEYLSYEMEFFRKANPNVRFIMHVPHMAHHHGERWLKDLDQLTENGWLIADWGGLVQDILDGKVQVPGATQDYSFHTFVINWREDDGFHQNGLCGYLTALMVYCAITGESAVGQPWEFTNDPSINPKFGWENMKNTHYSYNPETNFVEVFQSEADMHGLQQLADEYLAKFNTPSK